MGLSHEQLTAGIDALAAVEPNFARALGNAGYPEPRIREPGYTTLLRTIVGQQVSVAAAASVWARLEALLGADIPADALLAADFDSLRACGLSRQKIRYAQALARADLDFAALARAPDEAVIATLVTVPGIGRWTAEIYAMFSLGRADVFAAGDLALQEAARMLFDLPSRPGDRALGAMAADWSPWRAVAARTLWAYYRLRKGREGV